MPNKYNVGIHNVGSYQISGWPWITGSVIKNGATRKISFPMVTKSIIVKCKEIYISVPAHDSNSDGGYELFAEMTNIPASQMYPLTGSGVDE